MAGLNPLRNVLPAAQQAVQQAAQQAAQTLQGAGANAVTRAAQQLAGLHTQAGAAAGSHPAGTPNTPSTPRAAHSSATQVMALAQRQQSMGYRSLSEGHGGIGGQERSGRNSFDRQNSTTGRRSADMQRQRDFHASTSQHGNNPTAESMKRLARLSEQYGMEGQELHVGNKPLWKSGDAVHPSQIQKALFDRKDAGLSKHIDQAITRALQSDEGKVSAFSIGGGSGHDFIHFAQELKKRSPQGAELNVTTLDLDSKSVEWANKTKDANPELGKVNVLQSDAAEHFAGECVEHGSVDFATMSFTLSYLKQPGQFLQDLGDKMRPGGLVAFDVYGETHQTLDKGAVLNLHREDDVKTMLDKAGFDVLKTIRNDSDQEAMHTIGFVAIKRGTAPGSEGS